MTPEQFVFWLRGYFASGNSGAFSRGDWQVIAETLASVAAAARKAAPAPMPAPLAPGYPPITTPLPVVPYIVTCGTALGD